MLHHNPRPRSWELRGICWEPQALQLDRLETRGSPPGASHWVNFGEFDEIWWLNNDKTYPNKLGET